MSNRALKLSSPTNLCAFCATRIQCSAARPATKVQRRLFRSTSINRRPPAAAAAQLVEDGDDQWPETRWHPKTRSNPRWETDNLFDPGRSNTGISPQPSYRQNRQEPQQQYKGSDMASVMKGIVQSASATQQANTVRPVVGDGRPSARSPPPSARSQYSRAPDDLTLTRDSSVRGLDQRSPHQEKRGDMQLSYAPNWLCSCGFSNFRQNAYCKKCSSRRPLLNDWTCQKCQNINSPFQSACSHPNGQYKHLGGQDVPHFRRSISSTQMDQRTPRNSSPGSQGTFQDARAAEEERMEKRRATRNGWSEDLPMSRERTPSQRIPRFLEREGTTSQAQRKPEPKVDGPAAAAFPEDATGDLDSGISFDPSFAQEDELKTGFTRNATKQRPDREIARQRKIKRGGVLRGVDEEYEKAGDEAARSARREERLEQKKRAREAQKQAGPPKPIYIPDYISVSNLAPLLKVRVDEFLRKMKEMGFDELNNDHVLDAETAGLIAGEFHFEAILDQPEDQDLKPLPPAEDQSKLPARPPVVTIMGHVDHGKTTLLDYLRKSSVAASEHGGITQHIGAFSVKMPGGRLVTFLDTPGHEAFLAMRQRGANVTDIVILVVAADDSVMPQTTEAIKHAQSAKVPMIVAINKVDKEDANIERVKSDLSRHGVEIEDFGGDTQTVSVSGKTGEGLDKLEESTVALADLIDMRAETSGQVEGWVLEGTTKRAGRTATVLVRRGTLRPNDIIVAGTSWARVRCLRNEAGATIDHAGPGTPVEVDGWREQPTAGDEMLQAPDEGKAKSVIEYRLEAANRAQSATDIAAVNETRRLEQEKRDELKRAEEAAKAKSKDSDDQGTQNVETSKDVQATASKNQEVNLIIKADVSGSLEAVTNYISAIGNDLVRPHILRGAVGPISEFDIDHAAAAEGYIVSFNTAIDNATRRAAEAKGVRIIDASIIYRLVDEVKAVLSEKLPPTITQKVVGEAEVAQVFEINVKGRKYEPVAGCKIRNGLVAKGKKIRVLRGKDVIYDGTLSSLKSVKKDVEEMRKGTECGMSFTGFFDFKVGDQVQSYDEVVEKQKL